PATTNAEAHELYLKGRYYTGRFTHEAMKKGKDDFQKAIDLDPNYAPAYLGLAYYYGFAAADYTISPRVALPKAAEAAKKALAIDPTVAEAHAFLGWVYFAHDWNWSAAEQEFRLAIEGQPNDATVHELYSIFLFAMGRASESAEQARLALELDPLSPEVASVAAYGQLRRNPQAAIERLQQTIEMEPQYWYVRVTLA